MDGQGWDADSHERFRRDGVVCLRGAVAAPRAAEMADAVWSFLESHADTRRSDAATWPAGPPGISLKKLKRSRTLRSGVAAPTIDEALDDVFGDAGWHRSKSGPQILVTFPSDDRWAVPDRPWHMDAGFADDLDPPPGVKTFTVLEPLGERGGGTFVLAGSHRLQAAYAASVGPDDRGGGLASWSKLLRRDEWTDALQVPGEEPARSEALLAGERMVDGVPLRVVELAGEPGDVWLTHLHLFHCPSTGALDRPRLVVAESVSRDDRP